jgi:hypothetical protein
MKAHESVRCMHQQGLGWARPVSGVWQARCEASRAVSVAQPVHQGGSLGTTQREQVALGQGGPQQAYPLPNRQKNNGRTRVRSMGASFGGEMTDRARTQQGADT